MKMLIQIIFSFAYTFSWYYEIYLSSISYPSHFFIIGVLSYLVRESQQNQDHAVKQTKIKNYIGVVGWEAGSRTKSWVTEILLALHSGLEKEGSWVIYPRSAPAAKEEALEEVWAGARCAITRLSYRWEGPSVTHTCTLTLFTPFLYHSACGPLLIKTTSSKHGYLTPKHTHIKTMLEALRALWHSLLIKKIILNVVCQLYTYVPFYLIPKVLTLCYTTVLEFKLSKTCIIKTK